MGEDNPASDHPVGIPLATGQATNPPGGTTTPST